MNWWGCEVKDFDILKALYEKKILSKDIAKKFHRSPATISYYKTKLKDPKVLAAFLQDYVEKLQLKLFYNEKQYRMDIAELEKEFNNYKEGLTESKESAEFYKKRFKQLENYTNLLHVKLRKITLGKNKND